jgi:hypothetical protein
MNCILLELIEFIIVIIVRKNPVTIPDIVNDLSIVTKRISSNLNGHKYLKIKTLKNNERNNG